MAKKIQLSDHFGKMIITRNAIINLFDFINQLSEKGIQGY